MTVHQGIDDRARYERWNQKLGFAWASADYAKIGVTLQITGEELAETANFAPGSRVLDVAAGNGNVSLALARRHVKVKSTDYVPQMIEKGRARAQAESLDIDFQVADAQALPFEDDAFDGVVSTFGTMFAPDQPRTAAEMIRVCKPGGTIAFTAWTPQSFTGRVCAAIGRHMGSGSKFKSPQNWGRPEFIHEHFAETCTNVRVNMKTYNFRYTSAVHYLDVFRTNYGLMRAAFMYLGDEGGHALEAEILNIADRFNIAGDGTLCAPSDYAEVIVTK